jgi:hypothetical protein
MKLAKQVIKSGNWTRRNRVNRLVCVAAIPDPR